MAVDETGADRLGDRSGVVPVAHVDLDLAAAQAGGDLDRVQLDSPVLDLAQALGDLRLGDAEHAHGVSKQRRGASENRLHGACLDRPRPHRRSSRGGPGSTITTRSPAGTTRPGAVPTGSSAQRTLGDHRLLAIRRPHGLLVEAETPGEAAQDRRDLLLHFLVEDHLEVGRSGRRSPP